MTDLSTLRRLNQAALDCLRNPAHALAAGYVLIPRQTLIETQEALTDVIEWRAAQIRAEAAEDRRRAETEAVAGWGDVA